MFFPNVLDHHLSHMFDMYRLAHFIGPRAYATPDPSEDGYEFLNNRYENVVQIFIDRVGRDEFNSLYSRWYSEPNLRNLTRTIALAAGNELYMRGAMDEEQMENYKKYITDAARRIFEQVDAETLMKSIISQTDEVGKYEDKFLIFMNIMKMPNIQGLNTEVLRSVALDGKGVAEAISYAALEVYLKSNLT
eukprot:TRINITY_DN277_c0_g1_i6.p1 TRINITY_DN277_c0_g1~~TRINITY_DN277_c0_g1_i6.p1  ORF type:complete len:191 (-),score=28.73 TRINITY_DN277_c0_g1_i6:176-748(-)